MIQTDFINFLKHAVLHKRAWQGHDTSVGLGRVDLLVLVMPRLIHCFVSRTMLNIYTTDYSLYFVNYRRTKKAFRHTQFLV